MFGKDQNRSSVSLTVLLRLAHRPSRTQDAVRSVVPETRIFSLPVRHRTLQHVAGKDRAQNVPAVFFNGSTPSLPPFLPRRRTIYTPHSQLQQFVRTLKSSLSSQKVIVVSIQGIEVRQVFRKISELSLSYSDSPTEIRSPAQHSPAPCKACYTWERYSACPINRSTLHYVAGKDRPRKRS